MKFPFIPGEWRRLALVIGGEGLQSGLHFALNLVLIALLPAREYGAFAFVLVLGGVGLAYMRALAAMPASTYIGRAPSAAQANFYEGVFGAVALLLSVLLAAVAGAALATTSSDAAIGGAAVVGLWALRSHLRTVGFARRQAWAVTLGDAAFAVSGLVACAAALRLDEDRLQAVLLALAFANVVGAATISLTRCVRLRADFGRRARWFYFRLARRLAWSLYSVTATIALGQGVAFLVVAVAGPAGFAPIAAMLAFFAPLRIFSMSLANMLQPEISRLAAAGDEEGWRQVRATWTRRAVLLALLYGNVCLAALPHLHLRSLEHQPVMFIAASAWLLYAVVLAYLAPRILLETRMRFREIAAITTIGAIISRTVTAMLLHVAAPAYSLVGGVLGESVAAALMWRLAARPLTARLFDKSRSWRAGMAPSTEATYEAEPLI
jgi:hypothetical protein